MSTKNHLPQNVSEAWHQLVEREKTPGRSKWDATLAARRKRPELYQAYMAEANGGKTPIEFGLKSGI